MKDGVAASGTRRAPEKGVTKRGYHARRHRNLEQVDASCAALLRRQAPPPLGLGLCVGEYRAVDEQLDGGAHALEQLRIGGRAVALGHGERDGVHEAVDERRARDVRGVEVRAL